MSAEKNRRVLVIDDNRAIHDDFRKILSSATATAAALEATEEALFGPSATALPHIQFEIDSACQGQEGVLLAAKALEAGRPYALAFVDVRMPPGWDGVETTGKLWELDPNLQVVICTAYSDYSWGQMFEELGQRDGLLILKKPFDSVEAFQLAHALTEKWWLHQQSRRKMAELESMVAGRTEELANSLSLLNATFESTADGIVVVDLAGKVTSYNAKFTDIWQLPAEMLARGDAAEIRAYASEQAKDSPRFLRRAKELQADPEAEGFDVIELKDGRTFERYIFPQRMGRECVGTVISWRDVTERKRAEEELRESEDRYRLLVEESPDGIGIYQDGKLVFVNSTATRQLGATTQEDLLGRKSGQIIHPDDLPGATDRIRRRLAGETGMYPAEVRYLRLDGTIVPMEVSAAPITYNGRLAMQFIARDITERKQAENALVESKRFLRSTLDALSSHIAILDEHGKIIEVNAAWNRFARGNDFKGSHRGVGDDYLQLCDSASGRFSEESPVVARGIRAVMAGQRDEFQLEYPCHGPQEQRWFVVRVTRFGGAGPVRVVVAHENITERRLAEAKLGRTEELYQRAINGAGAVPYALDYKTKSYVFMGEGIEQLIGYAPREVTGQLWKQILLESVMGGETAGLSKEEAARRMATGEIRNWQCDMRIRARDGKLHWISDASVQRLDASGRPIGAMGILQDITERKRNEITALAFSKLGSHLSSVNSAREAFDIIKEVSKELFGWDAFCIRLYDAQADSIYSGFTIDTVQGQPVEEEHREPKQPGELHRRIIARGGELILREPPPAFGPDMAPFGDVLRPSAALLFVPIRSRGQVVGILSVQSYAPQAYNEQDLRTLQTMADQCGGAFERIWAEEALRNSEAQLFQSQKLETVGKLAGGVAHEFNSLLTAILGQSELIQGDLPPGHPLSQNAAEISKAADRAATLTRQLLAYGRRTFLRPESLDLNQVVAGMEVTIRHLVGSAVDVRILPAAALRRVKADAGQTEQVILNLVMNATDAMPNGGKLTLETANVLLDRETVRFDPDLKPGDYVMLAITDTGAGMSEAVKARAFEPFFTTKGVGQGTGLGLSTCHGIIKQSGGHISVASEPGRGTTFKIYLPQIEPEVKLPGQRLDSSDLPRGTETILLVEADLAMREMAAKLLTRLGYTVLAAASGIEALSLQQERSPGPIDLLFTDVVMPHLSGPELADRVRALHPQTRILFTSAYTTNASPGGVERSGCPGAVAAPTPQGKGSGTAYSTGQVHQGVLKEGVALLQKPYMPSALAHKLREVLDQPAPPT